MEQIMAEKDNSMMLEKIKNSKFQKIFQDEKDQFANESQPHISGQLQFKTHFKNTDSDIEYSPPKQKVKNDLGQVNNQLKSIKSKVSKFSKWDNYRPYSFAKLSSDQKDNVFQSLFQDFLSMKSFYNQYIDKYTRLNTKLHKIQNDLLKFKKPNLTGPEKIQVYKEQNKQNQQLKEQIKRLHQKIIALTSNKPSTKPKSAQNKVFANTQKTIFPVNQNLKLQLELQKKHVKQLLEVIDELRRSKMNLQSELKDKNFNKGIQNISLRPGERPGKTKSNFIGNQSKFKEYADELLMWKQKHQEMQLCYNKMNEDKDRIIGELQKELVDLRESERMKKNLERTQFRPKIDQTINEARIRQLQDTNYKLENQLKSLVRNPLFKDNTQVIDIKKVNKQLQDQIKKLTIELQSVKSDKTKYLAQLDLKTKQSDLLKGENVKLKKQLKQHIEQKIKSSNDRNQIYRYDQNDYYRKLLNLVKLQGDDPVWKKYADLVAPVFNVMTETQLKEIADSLWKSKIQLLAHLEKAQIELKTNKETNDSRLNIYIKQNEILEEELRVARARADQWMSMERVRGAKRDFQVYQHQGVKYNDSISVFQDEQDQIKALDSNQNFFDLYLGHLNLDQTNIIRHPQNKIKSVSNIISFLTLDFYNHPTQHSDFSEGLTKKLLNNFSFKVEINSYFIKFLNKNSIALQLWSPQGTATVLFGKGEIWLSDLLASSARDISNVIRGKCPIYSQNKTLIATVQYRMRMRLPISPFLQWANNKEHLNKQIKSDPFAINQHKKLAITIERAQGLYNTGSTFVYFSIQNEDFFTEPCQGSAPFWDYHRQIDVVVDEQFSSYLKENYIQFTLFDDDKQVNQDVVGIAKASFTPLLENNKPLNLVLQVEDSKFNKVGSLKIKAFWA